MIVGHAKGGKIISIEILNISKRMPKKSLETITGLDLAIAR